MGTKPADDAPMLDPKDYTVSVEFTAMPTEQVYVAETVKRAMEGDTEAVKTIYSDFATAIDLSSEQTWSAKVPWAYVRFVADRLRAAMMKDADVAAALVLSGKAGRPKGSKKYDHKAIAAFYFRLLWAGIEPKAAKSCMTESIGVSEDVIEQAARDYAGLEHPDQFKSNNPDLKGSYFDCLEQLAAPHGGKIAEIIAARKLHAAR
jgi:hypothetical protein